MVMLLHHYNHLAPQEKGKTLRIMQVNVGRGGPANDLALALAYEKDDDILRIQEPWIGPDLERRLSKRHRSYQAYASGEEWKERPRVITYVRRQTLRSVEKRQDILKITDQMPDMLVLKVQPSVDEEQVYIINSYNAPIGSERAGRSVDIMIEVLELLHKRVLIMEDFNLHHTNWNNRTVNPTVQAQRFVDWIAKKNAIYELKVSTVTHAGAAHLILSLPAI